MNRIQREKAVVKALASTRGQVTRSIYSSVRSTEYYDNIESKEKKHSLVKALEWLPFPARRRKMVVLQLSVVRRLRTSKEDEKKRENSSCT